MPNRSAAEAKQDCQLLARLGVARHQQVAPVQAWLVAPILLPLQSLLKIIDTFRDWRHSSAHIFLPGTIDVSRRIAQECTILNPNSYKRPSGKGIDA